MGSDIPVPAKADSSELKDGLIASEFAGHRLTAPDLMPPKIDCKMDRICLKVMSSIIKAHPKECGSELSL